MAPANAQSARLSGQVKDPTGAVIPGATVQLSGPAGSFSVTSDEAGRYTFAAVPAGTYDIAIQVQGFAPKSISGVVLNAQDRRTLDVAVDIAQQQEKVSVSAQSEASLDHNGDAIRLKGSDLDVLSTDSRQMQQELSMMAGGSGSQFYVDGFSGGKLPPKSSIREIRINQDPYSAEYDEVGFNRIQIFTKPGAMKRMAGTGLPVPSRRWTRRIPIRRCRNPFTPTTTRVGSAGRSSRRRCRTRLMVCACSMRIPQLSMPKHSMTTTTSRT